MTEEEKEIEALGWKERKEILEKEKEMMLLRHELRMKELSYIRESDRIHHERELERGRIKSAEIRKSQLQREMMNRRK